MSVVHDWRRNQLAITVASFVGFMGFTIVMPFLPLYFHEMGVEDVGVIALWTGLSLGITPAITAMLSPFWGRIADRFGRKVMVERSLVSFVVVMVATAYATQPWHVFALRAVQGLFAGYGALALTMATDSAPAGRLATAIGLVQTAQRLGPAVGPVVGGLLAPLVGLRRSFFVSAGFYLAALILIQVMYREPGRAVVETGSPDAERFRLRDLLRLRNLPALMAIIFGFQFVDRSLAPILPLYVAEVGVSMERVPLIAGLLFALVAGTSAIGNQVCARLLRHVSPRRIMTHGAGIAAVCMVVLVLARHLLPVSIAIGVFGVMVGMVLTAAYTTAGSAIPLRARGAGFGILTTASLTGLALSPIVSGFLATLTLRAVFVLGAVGMLLIWWRLPRSMDERVLDAP
jgi:DHA1 family multidrug resistance protein-like MFS transporter